MKKCFYAFGLAAIAAFAFSCQKEQEITNEEPQTARMVTITFNADKAGDETRTQAVVGESTVSYEWTNEDLTNIKLYQVDGNVLTEVANPSISKVSATRLTITATVPEADTYTFRAILAREYYAKGKPMVGKYQSPKTNNFDPKADILFSDDLVVETAGTSTDAMLMNFHRKVSVNQMTLKNLGVGEKVSKVEITSDKDLVGYYDGSNLVGAGNKLVLTYANEVVDNSGEFPVYFAALPNTGQQVTVKVTTDAKVYTKSFARTIDFALGVYKKFGVALPAGNVPPSDVWTLVTDASTLAAGDVIVIANQDSDYAISTVQNTNNRKATSITSSGNTISIDNNVQQISLESSTSVWYLNVGANQYLYAASTGSNHLKTSTKNTAGDNGKWAISIAANSSIATITAQGNSRPDMRYNLNQNSPIFSCYQTSVSTTTYPRLKIYRKTAAQTTVWNLKSIAVTTQPTTRTYNSGAAFDPTGMVVTATYEDNAHVAADKQVVLDNADLTISPVVLYTADSKVTVTFEGKTADVTGLSVSKVTPAITAQPASVILSNANDTQQITVDPDGSDGAITYVSDNTNVATVSGSGLITAIANGTATITIKTAETEDFNEGTTTISVRVGSLPYTLIKTSSSLETGVQYLIGGCSGNTFTTGAIHLWIGTTSSNQCQTISKTYNASEGNFNNVTDVAVVVFEAVEGETGKYYIKTGNNYLYNASGTTLSMSTTNKTAWTISDIGGEKEGVYFASATCKISSNGSSDMLRAYALTGNTYRGIVFFKKNN